jgi:hypothetical protein
MKRHLLMPAEGAKEKMLEGMHAAKSVVKKLIGRT